MEEVVKGDGMYMMKKFYMEPESNNTAEYGVRDDGSDIMKKPDLELELTNTGP